MKSNNQNAYSELEKLQYYDKLADKILQRQLQRSLSSDLVIDNEVIINDDNNHSEKDLPLLYLVDSIIGILI